MPIWGWVCVGLIAVVALGLTLIVWIEGRREERLQRDGQTVVARVILANTSVYDTTPAGFEFAFVVFTRDTDPSERHLAFLGQIAEELKGFEPDETDPEEKKLAWALETQRTIGAVVRIPARVTGGREVYFTSTPVKRRMLPDGRLTREYLFLRVILDGGHRDASMVEYPDPPSRPPGVARSAGQDGRGGGRGRTTAVGPDPAAAGGGSTPLHAAVLSGSAERVEALLACGADPNRTDAHGNGPLWDSVHLACLASRTDGNLEVVRLLAAAGADPDRKNRYGCSPRENAEQRDRLIAGLLPRPH